MRCDTGYGVGSRSGKETGAGPAIGHFAWVPNRTFGITGLTSELFFGVQPERCVEQDSRNGRERRSARGDPRSLDRIAAVRHGFLDVLDESMSSPVPTLLSAR